MTIKLFKYNIIMLVSVLNGRERGTSYINALYNVCCKSRKLVSTLGNAANMPKTRDVSLEVT